MEKKKMEKPVLARDPDYYDEKLAMKDLVRKKLKNLFVKIGPGVDSNVYLADCALRLVEKDLKVQIVVTNNAESFDMALDVFTLMNEPNCPRQLVDGEPVLYGKTAQTEDIEKCLIMILLSGDKRYQSKKMTDHFDVTIFANLNATTEVDFMTNYLLPDHRVIGAVDLHKFNIENSACNWLQNVKQKDQVQKDWIVELGESNFPAANLTWSIKHLYPLMYGSRRGKKCQFAFMDTRKLPGQRENRWFNKQNEFEAKAVADRVNFLILSGVHPNDIKVGTFGFAQSKLLERLMCANHASRTVISRMFAQWQGQDRCSHFIVSMAYTSFNQIDITRESLNLILTRSTKSLEVFAHGGLFETTTEYMRDFRGVLKITIDVPKPLENHHQQIFHRRPDFLEEQTAMNCLLEQSPKNFFIRGGPGTGEIPFLVECAIKLAEQGKRVQVVLTNRDTYRFFNAFSRENQISKFLKFSRIFTRGDVEKTHKTSDNTLVLFNSDMPKPDIELDAPVDVTIFVSLTTCPLENFKKLYSEGHQIIAAYDRFCMINPTINFLMSIVPTQGPQTDFVLELNESRMTQRDLEWSNKHGYQGQLVGSMTSAPISMRFVDTRGEEGLSMKEKHTMEMEQVVQCIQTKSWEVEVGFGCFNKEQMNFAKPFLEQFPRVKYYLIHGWQGRHVQNFIYWIAAPTDYKKPTGLQRVVCNVVLTRAKSSLEVIGDGRIFDNKPYLKDFLRTLNGFGC